MRAKFLLLFSALLTVFGLVFPMDNIAHAAHLGGMLTGIVFVRYAIHWHWHWPRLQRPRSQPLRPLVKPSAGSPRLGAKSKAAWMKICRRTSS